MSKRTLRFAAWPPPRAGKLCVGAVRASCAGVRRPGLQHHRVVAAAYSFREPRARSFSQVLQSRDDSGSSRRSFPVAGTALAAGTAACVIAAAASACLEPEPEEDLLPRRYDTESLQRYCRRRPWAVCRRCLEVVGELLPLAVRILWDWRSGALRDSAGESGDGVEEAAGRGLARSRAVELREALTRLGPAFIKAGQALAIRPDLVPQAALKELQRLCDNCPSFPWSIARATIEEQLGRKVEDVFEDVGDYPEPIAAASLGQVYRWRLKDTGAVVALKVQRPGMAHAVAIDIYILRRIAFAVRWLAQTLTHARVDHVMLLDAWARGMIGELDYEAEARHQEHFRGEMSRRMPGRVYVPFTYPDLTTQRVIASEWVNGPRLADCPPQTISELIPIGMECFLMQLLDMGSFHSDPHPGNLLVSEGRLVLLDFGLVAEIDDLNIDRTATCVVHLINAEYEALLDDFIALGFLPTDVDRQRVLRPLRRVLEQGMRSGADLKRRAKNFQAITDDLGDVFYNLPFMVPDYFALVTRALAVLEGIALVGNPEFDIFWAAYPYVLPKATAILGRRRVAGMVTAASAKAAQQMTAQERLTIWRGTAERQEDTGIMSASPA